MESVWAKDSMTRRQLLRSGTGAGLLAAVGVVAGCDAFSTEPSGAGASGSEEATKGREAPALAKLVESGDLPPVEQRLPESPVVVEPADRIGRYGGTWHSAFLGTADVWWLDRAIGYESLLRWTPEWDDSIPNAAESAEMSSDGRTYTIKLRKGLKWSDGEPVTADDLVFAVNDVFLNAEYSPVTPSWLISSDGRKGEAEAVDELTAALTFPVPNPLLMDGLATWEGGELISYPRHYLEQFHPEYNSEVDQEIDKHGFSDWIELFGNRANIWENAELPRIHPWLITKQVGEGSRVVAKRNPYYFKVDPEGSQLPYLDEAVFDFASDPEVILLKASNGELSFHTRHINSMGNKPVLASNREAGDYDFVELHKTIMNDMEIVFNLTHEDPVKREVFTNRDFRIGLSYAINRDELIASVFQQQGEAWQIAPQRKSRFFDEEFAKQYTEYDPDKANDHLDRAGYTERDGDGFRLGPDGKPISFVFAITDFRPEWSDAAELIKGYWAEVGVDIDVTFQDRSLFWERASANQTDARTWNADGGLNDEIQVSFGRHIGSAALWQEWYDTQGESGEEPPAATRRQMELYRQLLETPDLDEVDELFGEILDIAKEQFYSIGTILVVEGYGIIRNNFRNVPGTMFDTPGHYPNPGPSNPEQYFIE